MLTRGDLGEIDKLLTKRMRAELGSVREDFRQSMKTELKPLKNDISQIRKDIKTIVGFFDLEYLDLRKRVERIEEHLHLSAAL